MTINLYYPGFKIAEGRIVVVIYDDNNRKDSNYYVYNTVSKTFSNASSVWKLYISLDEDDYDKQYTSWNDLYNEYPDIALNILNK